MNSPAFLPERRDTARLNEVEFLTEVMCSALWRRKNPELLLLSIADNTRPNMRTPNGEVRKGMSLRSTRPAHTWIFTRQFRRYSFYSRAGRNLAANFSHRVSPSGPKIGKRNITWLDYSRQKI